MSKSIGRGTIVLIISGLICKLLGAFFRLPLTSILGIEGIGIFQMVMSVYSFALILTSGGVATALSKFVSQARARGDFKKIKCLLKTSLLYCIIFGAFVGLFMFLFSKQIAFLQQAEAGSFSYKLMLLLIPFGGIIATMRGIFQGYENMLPTAISQVLEQAVKFVLGLSFAYILGKNNVEEGVFGAFLGMTVGEIAAIVFLSIYLKIKIKINPIENKLFSGQNFLKAVIPLSVGVSVLPLVSALDSFLVVSRLTVAGFTSVFATQLFGLQTGVVGAILNFPLIISTSFSVAILPSISFLDAQLSNESENSVSKSLKVLWLVLLPLVFGICVISRPLYSLVYPSLNADLLNFAVNLTYLGGISTIISALMQFFLTLLQAKGKFNYCMISYIIGGVLKICSVIVLCALPSVNIFGVVIGNIILSSTVCIMALIKNKRKISVHFFDLSLPLLSSVAMALTVSLFLSKFNLSLIMQIVCSIIIGGSIYIFFTLPISWEIIKNILDTKLKEKENRISNQ